MKQIRNLRIDTRGHILAVQVVEYPSQDWVWYDLDGNVLSSGNGGAVCDIMGLRLDTRGHVVAVLKGLMGDGEYHWYGLGGDDLGIQALFETMYHLRIDSRGHVSAIGLFSMPGTKWYDLNGDLVA